MKVKSLKHYIEISLEICEKKLMNNLNSSSYSQESLIEDKEIDNLINKLIYWKEKNIKEKLCSEKVKELLYKIQIKDTELYEQETEIETI